MGNLTLTSKTEIKLSTKLTVLVFLWFPSISPPLIKGNLAPFRAGQLISPTIHESKGGAEVGGIY